MVVKTNVIGIIKAKAANVLRLSTTKTIAITLI